MNRRRRLTKIKNLFDILLLFTNSIGILGALLEVLQVPFGSKDRMVFWVVLFCFCAAAILFWNGGDKKALLKRSVICAALYVFVVLIFRTEVTGGFFLGLRDAVENLNERYQFHLAWTDGLKILREAGWERGSETWIIMFAMLTVVFPFIMLAGLLLKKGRVIGLALGNLLWFVAACSCDIFPDFFFLIFCILGAAAALVQREFNENYGAGLAAVAWVVTLSGIVLGLIYFYLMPVLDVKYEEGHDDRVQFYRMVNEELIPWVQEKVSGLGFGSGTDVTGSLYRENLLAYTADDIYRVTVDRVPEGVLYLKGFVGSTYGKREWKASSDRELEQYYKKAGFILPEDYSQLPNISYEALGGSRGSRLPGYIQIEELADRGSYSVYPYGALLTEDFRVHADGSVARRGSEYDFQYRYLGGLVDTKELKGQWKRLEKHYRRYVYDSFLEYPKGLEKLTEELAQAGIRTDSIYHCASDIMTFLDRHAVYDLDAGKNPSGTDFVEYFLFESHEGYCVHFASSAVLAFRYFGIPARFAAGYVVAPSDFTATEGGRYTAVVKSRQAHAWAEIYLDGIGWVPVEMTPGAVAVADDNRVEQLMSMGGLAGESNMQPPAVRQEGEPFIPETSEPVSPSEIERDPFEDPDEKSHPEDEPEEKSDPEEESGAEEEPSKDSDEKSDLEDESNAKGEPLDEPEEKSGTEDQANTGSQSMDGTSADHNKDSEEELSAEGSMAADGEVQPNRKSFDWHILVVALEVSGMAAIPVALVFLGRYLRRRAVLRWHRKLQAAGARRQVLLLYRNLRRVLQIAGCPERLEVDGEAFRQKLERLFPRTADEAEQFRSEYQRFCSALETASFSDREPSVEELQVVVRMHDELVKEAYGKISLYKRPLFGVLRCYHDSAA